MTEDADQANSAPTQEPAALPLGVENGPIRLVDGHPQNMEQ